MAGKTIQVEIILFDILPVIPLGTAQTKQALFQVRVGFIPQGNPQTNILQTVAESSQTVFVPSICPAAGVVVREISPGIP